MTKKKERAKIITQILERYYPDPDVPLNSVNEFTFLVAVLLSAQTTDERVNIITPKLFKRAHTPQIMATLSVSEIESYIKTCGLYRNKAKSIVALSQTLVTSYNGKVPHDRSLLEALPGVGKKTAGVFIAQQTCGNAFPVDTHIKRCAHRWKLSKNNDPNKIEKDLQGLFPKTLWNKLHLQIILYARKYSPAKAFDPLKCEIQQFVDAQTQRKKNMSSTSLYFM